MFKHLAHFRHLIMVAIQSIVWSNIVILKENEFVWQWGLQNNGHNQSFKWVIEWLSNQYKNSTIHSLLEPSIVFYSLP